MLREKRKENGLTQSKLAKKIGISKGYLSKLEKYPHFCNPNVNLILKLSKELDVSPLKIFSFFIEKKLTTNED